MAHIKEKHKKILDENKKKFNKEPEWKGVARKDYSLCYDVRGRFDGYGKESGGGDNRAVQELSPTLLILTTWSNMSEDNTAELWAAVRHGGIYR